MLVKRENNMRGNSLSTVYRPCTVDELIGNGKNKQLLKNYLDNNKLPRTLLFSGQAGCGKTSVARIIALSVNCEATALSTSAPCLSCQSCKSILNGNNIDIHEVNVGRDGGKDAIEKLVKDLPSAPFNARNKVLILDEAHKLTDAAKDLLLKEIEDGYSHVYFIFCTNQPDSMKSKKVGGDAFLSRCSRMQFDTLPIGDIKAMLINVVQYEGEEYKEDVINLIAEETKGVPRDALVILNDIMNEGSWSLEAVNQFLGILLAEDSPQLLELCRALSFGRFKDSIGMFDKLNTTLPVEAVRIAVCGYFVACLKKAGKIGEGVKLSKALDILSVPIYMTGKPAEYVFYNNMFKVTQIMADRG